MGHKSWKAGSNLPPGSENVYFITGAKDGVAKSYLSQNKSIIYKFTTAYSVDKKPPYSS